MSVCSLKREAIQIDLGEERGVRTFKYTLGSLASMESRFGSVESALSASSDAESLIYLIYLGLNWEDEELTEEYISKLIEIRDVKLIMDNCVYPAMNADIINIDGDTKTKKKKISSQKKKI